MSMITPFPEAESAALERFALVGPTAVAALLRELRDRKTPVTLYSEDAGAFTVGQIVNVDVDREAVRLDWSEADGVQPSMDCARGLTAVGFLDGTKVQFTLTGAGRVEAKGQAVFRFPARAFRIQRRGAPRRHPPGGRPALCRVPHPQDVRSHEQLRVLDISVGGLALLVTPPLFELVRDQVLDPCYLDLPEVGQIGVALKVRYLDESPAEAGRRCGCEFVRLTEGARRALQVYLGRLEGSRPPDEGRRAA